MVSRRVSSACRPTKRELETRSGIWKAYGCLLADGSEQTANPLAAENALPAPGQALSVSFLAAPLHPVVHQAPEDFSVVIHGGRPPAGSSGSRIDLRPPIRHRDDALFRQQST